MSEAPRSQVGRHLEATIRELMTEEPVVVVHGPRTAGKSTLVGSIARSLRTTAIDLDDPSQRETASADPNLVVAGEAPVIIDEFQQVPVLVDAVKAELNRSMRPGRFVLTGSARSLSLPWFARALSGRAHVVTLWPFSQGELAGARETFIDQLLGDPGALVARAPTLDRGVYLEQICAGGFPVALARSRRARERWFDDYVDLLTTQDAAAIRRVRSRTVLRDLMVVLAERTGQLLNVAEVARTVGLDKSTCADLVELLEAVFLVLRLPAWGRTITNAAVHPKVHVTDTGVASRLMGVTARTLSSSRPDAFRRTGHLLETFAILEVHKQTGWCGSSVRLGHFRTHDGAEADLVVEASDGSVAALDVKAGTRVRPDDIRGLTRLHRRLGSRFTAGVLLYTGPAHRIADRLWALPVASLWTPA